METVVVSDTNIFIGYSKKQDRPIITNKQQAAHGRSSEKNFCLERHNTERRKSMKT